MTISDVPAMATNPSCIFFTDFDGTITMRDSNDYLTDNLGFGYEKRRELNFAVLEERMTFRDAFQAMIDSVKGTNFPDAIQILCDNIQLDPYFKDFYEWSLQNNVPVVVVSSGLTDVIRGLLVHLLGPSAKQIQIVSNEVADRPGSDRNQPGGWTIEFHDDSGFGHDKSLCIKPYHKIPNRPTLLYAGDGVSDLSAARETDLLFAKTGYDLVTYCERQGVPFTTFEDWKSILETTREIVEGKKSVKKVAAEGVQAVHMNGNAVRTTK
ncbi:MAG: Ribosome biogenesis protein brx1 [Chaenotheca gracillima]|nr:MAG: Ribosome biogenesis protein brx1 [Chaenotheca gracillima]